MYLKFLFKPENTFYVKKKQIIVTQSLTVPLCVIFGERKACVITLSGFYYNFVKEAALAHEMQNLILSKRRKKKMWYMLLLPRTLASISV